MQEDLNPDLVRMPFSAGTRGNLRELLDDRFMQAYTTCSDLDAFMFSSAVFVNWDDDVLLYSKSRLDAFVAETTQFSTWDEMLKKAAAEYSR